MSRAASQALSKVRPGDFPATREELRRDAEALQDALSLGSEADDAREDAAVAAAVAGGQAEIEDLEARYRAGEQ